MVRMPDVYKPCTKNVCGYCSELRVKCLEVRMFGGVEFGSCAIRDPKGLHSPWPRRPSVPTSKPRAST